MTEMYAVLKDKSALGAAIRRVDVPGIGSGNVLVKVERAAICGADLHIFNWDVVASFIGGSLSYLDMSFPAWGGRDRYKGGYRRLCFGEPA